MRRTLAIATLAIATLVAAIGTTARVLVPSSEASVSQTEPETTPVVALSPASIAQPEPIAQPATEAVIEPTPAPIALDGPARIALYGDSLASEAEGVFAIALAGRPGFEVRTHTFGGTAICDWLDEMRAEAVEWRPHAVVVEFSGNALTPCMADVDPDLQYQTDADEVLRIFDDIGAIVYLAGAPISRSAAENGEPAAMNALYRRLASSVDHARYINAGAAVLDNGRYTDNLPCLPDEPCTGGVNPAGVAVNVVRAPDGGHFCPGSPDATNGVTSGCPVWSSGAYRYSLAMAAPIIRDFKPSATQ